jgi:hypothetical protein
VKVLVFLRTKPRIFANACDWSKAGSYMHKPDRLLPTRSSRTEKKEAAIRRAGQAKESVFDFEFSSLVAGISDKKCFRRKLR